MAEAQETTGLRAQRWLVGERWGEREPPGLQVGMAWLQVGHLEKPRKAGHADGYAAAAAGETQG